MNVNQGYGFYIPSENEEKVKIHSYFLPTRHVLIILCSAESLKKAINECILAALLNIM